jgi:hypothetical protein
MMLVEGILTPNVLSLTFFNVSYLSTACPKFTMRIWQKFFAQRDTFRGHDGQLRDCVAWSPSAAVTALSDGSAFDENVAAIPSIAAFFQTATTVR